MHKLLLDNAECVHGQGAALTPAGQNGAETGHSDTGGRHRKTTTTDVTKSHNRACCTDNVNLPAISVQMNGDCSCTPSTLCAVDTLETSTSTLGRILNLLKPVARADAWRGAILEDCCPTSWWPYASNSRRLRSLGGAAAAEEECAAVTAVSSRHPTQNSHAAFCILTHDGTGKGGENAARRAGTDSAPILSVHKQQKRAVRKCITNIPC